MLRNSITHTAVSCLFVRSIVLYCSCRSIHISFYGSWIGYVGLIHNKQQCLHPFILASSFRIGMLFTKNQHCTVTFHNVRCNPRPNMKAMRMLSAACSNTNSIFKGQDHSWVWWWIEHFIRGLCPPPNPTVTPSLCMVDSNPPPRSLPFPLVAAASSSRCGFLWLVNGMHGISSLSPSPLLLFPVSPASVMKRKLWHLSV